MPANKTPEGTAGGRIQEHSNSLPKGRIRMKAHVKARYALVATAAALVLSACSTTSDLSQKQRVQPRQGSEKESAAQAG
jgi:hypothetical protein